MKKMKFYILGLFLFFSASQLIAQQTPHYNTKIGDRITGFYDYLPATYSSSPTKNFPLYIVLQGVSELGDGSTAQLPKVLNPWGSPPWQINQGKWPSSFTVNGASFSFIVFTPQFSSSFGANDIKSAIDYCVSHYRVDLSRIYLSGISMGGGALWSYMSTSVEYASRIAAAIPISGSSGPSQPRADIIATADLPVWATTSSLDPVVSPSNTIGWVQDINGAPAPPNPRAKLSIFEVEKPTHTHATAMTYSLTYKENGLNAYEWMLQYTRGGTLPVTGFELHANQTASGKIMLNWKTEQEINNSGFVAERSRDGQSYDSLTFVPTSSANGSGGSYSFEDLSPLAGLNYYRIKQVDKDGKYAFSNIEYIDNKNPAQLQIFPNPVSGVLHIQSNETFLNAKILIRNVNGQLVKEMNLSGNGSLQIPVNGLTPGFYSIRILNGKSDFNKSFIKK